MKKVSKSPFLLCEGTLHIALTCRAVVVLFVVVANWYVLDLLKHYTGPHKYEEQ